MTFSLSVDGDITRGPVRASRMIGFPPRRECLVASDRMPRRVTLASAVISLEDQRGRAWFFRWSNMSPLGETSAVPEQAQQGGNGSGMRHFSMHPLDRYEQIFALGDWVQERKSL